MLLAGVDVITVHVDDVLIARADKLRRGSLLQLGNPHTSICVLPNQFPVHDPEAAWTQSRFPTAGFALDVDAPPPYYVEYKY
jgi:hypothetical protein